MNVPARSFRACALLATAMLMAGCAADLQAGYPSLARRPIEQQANVVAPSVPTDTTPAVVSATLIEALAGLARDADSGARAFAAALADDRGQAEAGRSAATGSEAWATGQVALSRIVAARAPSTLALSELDRLAANAADAGDQTASDAITPVQARVAAMVDDQNRTIAALGG